MSGSEDEEWDWSDEEWDEDPYNNDYVDEMVYEVPQLTSQISYFVMDEKQIAKKQMEAIEQLVSMLGLNRTQSAAMLQDNDWDVNQACAKFMDGSTMPLLLLERSVSNIRGKGSMMCATCYCDYDGTEMRALECGHAFCEECYRDHLLEQVSQGMKCIFACCPQAGCPIVVSEELFKELLPADKYKKYSRYILRSFVEQNQSVKWCPAPACEFAVEYPKRIQRDIKCRWGYVWCFAWGQQGHRPLSCEMMSKWEEKNKAGSGDDDWFLLNTKVCPGCKNRIQKNLGCMHMTCRCGHEFCWLCMGPWSEHGGSTGGYYACNKYNADQQAGKYKQEERAKVIAEQSLQRYDHYYNRYVAHKGSIKFAKDKRDTKLNEIKQISQMAPEVNPADIDIFDKMTDLVYDARQCMANSYALGYFMTSPPKITLFEFLQGDLESRLDELDKKTDVELSSFLTEEYPIKLSNEYYEQRQHLLTLYDVVKENYEQIMRDAEAGFPQVQENEYDIEAEMNEALLRQHDAEARTARWTCAACTLSNAPDANNCEACQTPRPTL